MARGRKIVILLAACISAVFLCSCGKSGVKIDDKHFPDKIFREYISDNFDATGDGYLDNDEIIMATVIDLPDQNVESLDGIQNFTSLRYLRCRNNSIKKLDVSKCSDLEVLYCSENQLEELKVNPSLIELHCYENQLEKLALNKCFSLEELACHNNKLTELDTSKCTNLTTLSCSYNQLTKLDISNCSALKLLYCRDNRLTKLDLSDCASLNEINCINNSIKKLDIRNCTNLDPGDIDFWCDDDVEIIK